MSLQGKLPSEDHNNINMLTPSGKPSYLIPGINGKARCLRSHSLTAADSSRIIANSRTWSPTSTTEDVHQAAAPSLSFDERKRNLPDNEKHRRRRSSSRKKEPSTKTNNNNNNNNKTTKKKKTKKVSRKEQTLHDLLKTNESSKVRRRAYDDSDLQSLSRARNLHGTILKKLVQKQEEQLQRRKKKTRRRRSNSRGEDAAADQDDKKRLQRRRKQSLGALLVADGQEKRCFDDQDVESLSLAQNLQDSILCSVMKGQSARRTLTPSPLATGSDHEATILQDVGHQDEAVFASLSPEGLLQEGGSISALEAQLGSLVLQTQNFNSGSFNTSGGDILSGASGCEFDDDDDNDDDLLLDPCRISYLATSMTTPKTTRRSLRAKDLESPLVTPSPRRKSSKSPKRSSVSPSPRRVSASPAVVSKNNKKSKKSRTTPKTEAEQQQRHESPKRKKSKAKKDEGKRSISPKRRELSRGPRQSPGNRGSVVPTGTAC